MYVVAITLAVIIARRRWRAVGGNPDLVSDVAVWAVPAGIIGGRIYFDITTPFDIRPAHAWWGPLAVWDGGLGVWGGIAAGAAVGIWRVHRAGADWRLMADAVAPALLVAQAPGGSGTTSTRSCTASRPACPGTWRSHQPTGWPAIRSTPRSSRRSFMS